MTTQLHDRLDDARNAGQVDGLHSVVVRRGGETLLEYYGSGEDFSWGDSLGVVEFGPTTLHDLRSVTKSVTGLVYGIALGQGLVPAPEEPLLRHFPRYPDLAADPERARLTVEHVLTMSLGLEWREDIPYNSLDNAEVAMEFAPDRYRFVLERPIVEPPGQRWAYNGGATALLGKLIADGTGQPLQQYAQAVLFEPLGITSFGWLTGQDGVASPASGLRLAPRDLARIGELVLAEGEWHGQRVVPAEWIHAMLQPRLTTHWGAGYGYQWYIDSYEGHRLVTCIGNGGQRLDLLRDLDVAVAITAGNYDDPEQWRTPHAVLERVIMPTFG
jgi:CubicO group peptidase (beta-lactamase class C family)